MFRKHLPYVVIMLLPSLCINSLTAQTVLCLFCIQWSKDSLLLQRTLKEEFREFDIYFLIENNYYQQMHYTKSVKTLWNTTCVFLFFTNEQVSIIQNKKDIYASKRLFVKLIY